MNKEATAAAVPVAKLLDHLIGSFKLKNDARLSRFLEITPPAISKLRHGKQPITAAMILAIHEKSGMPVKRIREFINGL